MYDLTTVGDIKLDVFLDLGSDAKVTCAINKKDCMMSLKYGTKIPVDSADTMMAGSAPNVAIGIRRLGGAVSIVSVLGDDSTATLALDVLKKEGLSTDYVTIAKGTKSSFSAVLNFNGESTILAVHEPHDYVIPSTLRTAWIFVSELGPNYKQLYTDIIKLSEQGVKIGINPGAIQLEEQSSELYKLIETSDLLILNKKEAEDLCDSPTDKIEVLMRTMKELGPATLIITDGLNGSFATNGGEIFHAPIFDIGDRVEATGAGDAFSTGVLGSIIMGHDIPTALMWGSVNSGSVIKYVGPQRGLLTQQQILSELNQQPNFKVVAL